jgi:PPOX class probable F420-dependent enzyme
MQLSETVRKFLAEPRFAVLATINKDGLPQQSVMWFELRGEQIIMNTAQGRLKDRNIRRDNRVSVCWEDGYAYLAITGTVELNDDQTVAQADIKALAHRYNGPDANTEHFQTEHRITWTITIDKVDARGIG